MFKLIKVNNSYPNYSFNIVLGENVLFKGAVMYEHEVLDCFKPWELANTILKEHALTCDIMTYNKLTNVCHVVRFEGSQHEMIMRFDCKLVELFDCKGNCIESIKY